MSTFTSFGLTGGFPGKIEGKNRLKFPAPLKNRLKSDGDEEVVLWCDKPGKFFLFPATYWDVMQQRILDSAEKSGSLKMWKKVTKMGLDSSRVKIDDQGRVTIPMSLLEKAGLKKDVFIVGTADRVAVWDPALLEEFVSEPDEDDEDDFSVGF